MTDNINPSHYKTGPFECIELTSLLSSDWGNVVKYAYRWQHKNGVEDLKKAERYIRHALDHNIPFIAAWSPKDEDVRDVIARKLLRRLYLEDWASLGLFWQYLARGDRVNVLEILKDKTEQVEKEGK